MSNEQRRQPSQRNQHAAERREGFLARLNALETIVLAAILLIALAGLMLVGKGFYLKATAQRAGADAQTGLSEHRPTAVETLDRSA